MTDRSYLNRVQRPARYLGREINAVFKDPRAVDLRAALLFPDLYEVGMSHLGLALLYDLLNRQEWLWAERAYAPAPDLEAELRSRRLFLGSLESGSPLKNFHLLGVSLQYELSYTNILAMLDLGGVPLMAADRGPEDPVVIGGGPGAFNPEPVAPFFDALVLGDGEEAALEVAAEVKDWRASRGNRQELWQALEDIEGVYVPTLFEPAWDEEGFLREIVPRGRRQSIAKRVLDDLDRIPLSPLALVPSCQIVHDRLNLEILRGCTRGCRYCQAGIIYRPVRERRPAAVLDWVEEALAATGFEEVSLLSLSPGDYQGLPWLLTRLMDYLAPRAIALSLPSLRADTVSPEMVGQIQRVRRTGLTIAPEAGSERLREVVNKNLTEEMIVDSARRAFKNGWRLLKLYFMLGLPTETKEDQEAIARLARHLLKAGPGAFKPRLNVSLSTFIPKPHTPLQWERQAGLAESRERLNLVKDGLKHPQVQVKWNSAAQSWLEGVFSRGDRRLAPVLLAAYRRGCRLDAWSEHLNLEAWRQAFAEEWVDPDFYLRAREPREVLPWDHLKSGVSRDFLLAERDRAYQGAATPDCRLAGCQDCGACDHDKVDLKVHQAPALLPDPIPPALRTPASPVWYRLTFAKLEEARWLSHLELVSAFYRSLRRSGLPLAFTSGYHPLPRVAFHGALPVGVESLAETLDLALEAELGGCTLVSQLNRALPRGLRVLTLQRLPGRWPPPQVEASVYQVESPEELFSSEAAARFLSQEEVWATRRRPGKEKPVNVRALVGELRVVDSEELQIKLNYSPQGNLKVGEVLAVIFGLTGEQVQDLHILKSSSVFLQENGKPQAAPSPCGEPSPCTAKP